MIPRMLGTRWGRFTTLELAIGGALLFIAGLVCLAILIDTASEPLPPGRTANVQVTPSRCGGP
jgi:hypothetical protein